MWRSSRVLFRLHRLTAMALLLFVVVHVLNHLVGLAGPDQHMAFQQFVHRFYGHVWLEVPLHGLFALQAAVGGALAWRGRKRWTSGGWSMAQGISGIVFAAFILQHIAANWMLRLQFPDLSRNFFWAASVAVDPLLRWYFLPYYFAGFAALFVHLAAVVRLGLRRKGAVAAGERAGWLLGIAGTVAAAAVTLTLGGQLASFTLPAANQAYLDILHGR